MNRSSVRARVAGRDDALVSVKPLLDRAPRLADLIEGEPDEASYAPLRRAEPIGRPIGAPASLQTLARRLGRAKQARAQAAKRRRGRDQKGKCGRVAVIPQHRNTVSRACSRRLKPMSSAGGLRPVIYFHRAARRRESARLS
ncbi:MAG: hypothetical protein ACLQJL_16120 [Roseiarcus sp.]